MTSVAEATPLRCLKIVPNWSLNRLVVVTTARVNTTTRPAVIVRPSTLKRQIAETVQFSDGSCSRQLIHPTAVSQSSDFVVCRISHDYHPGTSCDKVLPGDVAEYQLYSVLFFPDVRLSSARTWSMDNFRVRCGAQWTPHLDRRNAVCPPTSLVVGKQTSDWWRQRKTSGLPA